ncbi:EamA family transporter, partial [Rhizobium sp.]|uniref:EamA family transporter n=1 Tax=Rhizobium sp. TaxID=391 RepID=UPI0039183DB3
VTFRAAGPQEKKISLFGAGILGGIVICGVTMLPSFEPPSMIVWFYLAGYGLLAAFANVLLMYAAVYAPAAYIGPTQYSQMLWALFLGHLLFGDGVDGPTLAGTVLIIGSGILTVMREHHKGTPLPPAIAASSAHAALTLKRPPVE